MTSADFNIATGGTNSEAYATADTRSSVDNANNAAYAGDNVLAIDGDGFAYSTAPISIALSPVIKRGSVSTGLSTTSIVVLAGAALVAVYVLTRKNKKRNYYGGWY